MRQSANAKAATKSPIYLFRSVDKLHFESLSSEGSLLLCMTSLQSLARSRYFEGAGQEEEGGGRGRE